MTGRDLTDLDVLRSYLAEASAFLEEEKRRLEGWRSSELARDERLTSEVLRPPAEGLPRLLEATRQLESWLPQLEDSFRAVREELDTLRQEHTQPGQILISRSAYEVGRDLIETTPLEPMAIKGHRDPEQVYELSGLRCL